MSNETFTVHHANVKLNATYSLFECYNQTSNGYLPIACLQRLIFVVQVESLLCLGFFVSHLLLNHYYRRPKLSFYQSKSSQSYNISIKNTIQNKTIRYTKNLLHSKNTKTFWLSFTYICMVPPLKRNTKCNVDSF